MKDVIRYSKKITKLQGKIKGKGNKSQEMGGKKLKTGYFNICKKKQLAPK